ncbi:hypothetical protein SNEBB_011268 [Seison nebaliae]|nr:hypothetical protein SNEBB_011268 [Seison nebaliae]
MSSPLTPSTNIEDWEVWNGFQGFTSEEWLEYYLQNPTDPLFADQSEPDDEKSSDDGDNDISELNDFQLTISDHESNMESQVFVNSVLTQTDCLPMKMGEIEEIFESENYVETFKNVLSPLTCLTTIEKSSTLSKLRAISNSLHEINWKKNLMFSTAIDSQMLFTYPTSQYVSSLSDVSTNFSLANVNHLNYTGSAVGIEDKQIERFIPNTFTDYDESDSLLETNHNDHHFHISVKYSEEFLNTLDCLAIRSPNIIFSDYTDDVEIEETLSEGFTTLQQFNSIDDTIKNNYGQLTTSSSSYIGKSYTTLTNPIGNCSIWKSPKFRYKTIKCKKMGHLFKTKSISSIPRTILPLPYVHLDEKKLCSKDKISRKYIHKRQTDQGIQTDKNEMKLRQILFPINS